MKFINLKSSKEYYLFYIFLGLSITLFLYFLSQFSFFITLKITLLFCLILSPFFFYNIYFTNSKLFIPYLHVFCFLLFFFYCLSLLVQLKFFFSETHLISKVINILLLSMSSLFAGYFILDFFLKNRSIKINFFLRNSKINFILYISTIYLIFFYAFSLFNNIKYAVFLKNVFLYLFIVSLAYFFSQEKKNKKNAFLFFIFNNNHN